MKVQLHKLTWQGQHMTHDDQGHIVWVGTPDPQGGESVSMGSLGMMDSAPRETATHYMVPVTTWGDYCGDSCARSNYRSLLRDYPDTFVEVEGGYWSHYLAIPCANLTDDLYELFTNLAEQYPLYDEDDHSNLEVEEAEEQWNSWAIQDVLHSLSRAYGVDTDLIDEDQLTETFWSYVSECPEYPYLEDAVTVCFPMLDDFIRTMGERYGQQ